MRLPGVTSEKGIIAWFAANHVAANLLMMFIIVAGLMTASSVRKQSMPEFELNWVQVMVPYLGAAPEEVEEGVVVRIEEAVQDIEGIKRIRSTASEGMGRVMIEGNIDADINELLNEVKTRVDAISTFPVLTEKPVIEKIEPRSPVVMIAIHGDMDDFARKDIAQEVRDELMQLPAVNRVVYLGDRPYEISIEVSEATLRKFGMTMSEISQAVRSSSVDLPGGTIRSEGGDILLRTKGQVYTGAEFGRLVLRTFPDGTRLTLDDIATIKDGFVERGGYGRFDGKPTAVLQVVAGGQQNELETAAAVKAYLADKEKTLPDGVAIDTWIDISQYLQGRLDMMFDNILMGALLVFVVLSLFLRMKVAFWVIVGLPVCFLGALWLMPMGNITINMISLFGFIIVLGIVVDDAIIIGESIYTKIRADGKTLDNVILGAHRVAIPATFGVLTTIAAFAPMMFIGGVVAPFFEAMGFVVIACLAFSLIESKLILPAHLANTHIPEIDEDDLFHPQREIALRERLPRALLKLQRYVQQGLQKLIHDYYKPLLLKAVDNAGVTVSIFVGILIITFGLMGSGAVRVLIFPEMAPDFIEVNLQMQTGTPTADRDRVVDRLEGALMDIAAKHQRENPDSLPVYQHLGVFASGDTGARLFVEVPMDVNRPYEMGELEELWRDEVGELPGLKELRFKAAGAHVGGGPPLSFRISGSNYDNLEKAAAELELKLGEYEGVLDITNSAAAGGDEIKLVIKPEAEALGLTMSSLGRQVRQAFYGEEAQRIQRGKDELRVMVRYPLEERKSIADLENMRIRTPDGDEVPFQSVAEVTYGQGYSYISRLDRERTVTVSADIDPALVEPQQVIRSINNEFLPELLARYPGVRSGLEGSSEEEGSFLKDIGVAFIAAMFLIYALIAIPLRSYSQPLIIMSVIPFGLIGAVIGHVVMDMPISMFSMFGLIALAGVVVNDSLIMIDFVNKARVEGVPTRQAIVESGIARFRAIILTSFTTAAGLMPIVFETSTQATYIKPTAVSIGFGIIFATVITLFLIPASYVLQDAAFARGRRMRDWLLGREPVSDATD